MRSRPPRKKAWLSAVALTALVALGSALASQHLMGQMPCAWCVLQRLIFVAVAVAAGLGVVLPGTLGSRLGAGLALPLALSGAAAALWQHLVAAQSASCNMSLADQIMGATGFDSRWPQVFAAYASCAEAQTKLLGLPYEYWSFALFTLLAGISLRVLTARNR